MTTRRQEIMKELGLWPNWRLRESIAAGTTVEATL